MSGHLVPAIEELIFAYRKERDEKNSTSGKARLDAAKAALHAYLSEAYAGYFTVAEDSLEFTAGHAISSNSICFHFMTEADGKPHANARLFGKIPHGDANEIAANNEASRASLLEKAGYPIDVPVISPVGNDNKEAIIYRYANEAEKPVVHFLALGMEDAGAADSRFADLVHEYDHLQERIGKILTASLHSGDAPPCAKERFHELFHRRVVDNPDDERFGGRVRRFYLGKNVNLPNGGTIPFGTEGSKEKSLWNMNWRINGRRHPHTLRRMLEQARDVLRPGKLAPVYVTAHGDDHTGNMRYDGDAPAGRKILCFDPEFSGARIPALMAMTKSLCNSALAHPHLLLHPEKHSGRCAVELTDDTINIDFDDALTPLRQNFLQSQLLHVWTPLVKAMHDRGLLPENWEIVSRSALFCCMLLPRNLISEDRMLRQTSLASLAMAVMFASAPLEGRDNVSNFFEQVRSGLA